MGESSNKRELVHSVCKQDLICTMAATIYAGDHHNHVYVEGLPTPIEEAVLAAISMYNEVDEQLYRPKPTVSGEAGAEALNQTKALPPARL